jgi:hypothetical protein
MIDNTKAYLTLKHEQQKYLKRIVWMVKFLILVALIWLLNLGILMINNIARR